MNDVLLQVEDLHTYFYTNDGIVKSVGGIDFTVRKGETLCIVGESGCGKSVTALSIMGLIPDPPGKIVQGKILFDNKNLVALSQEEMRHVRGNQISMIFQEPMTSLNPVFKVGDQIAEVVRIHQASSRRQAMDRAVEMLNRVGIPDPVRRAGEYPHQLSGGMRQRVMIAMALACNPRLIIADEPTTALDVTIQGQILDLMNDLKESFGASILLITHDLGVVAETAQWVAVMYAGKIVEYAEVKDLFLRPKHPYTNGLMASIPDIETPAPADRMLKTIKGMVPSLAELPAGCSFQGRCPMVMDRCYKEEPLMFDFGSDHKAKCWLYANE